MTSTERASPSPAEHETARRLAHVAGRYRERRPEPALHGHVSRVWINEIARRTELHVVPDGCMDIIWTGSALQVAGPDTRIVVETVARATLVGIRFLPGAAPAWLRSTAAGLLNSRPPLEAFWGRATTEPLSERLCQLANPDAVARLLERTLVQRLPNAGAVDPFASVVVHAVTREGSQHQSLIGWLLSELRCSERTLRRRCDDAFGYGPKLLQRILRFQRFQRLLGRRTHPQLSLLALEAGYADQAHVTRESRQLSGLTPRRLIAELARLRGRFVQDAGEA